ncbi:fructose-1,6-bisphosphatase [Companilactobacillus kimchiensis]|uniref:Fructose-1,6-bisphosphatase class 3 n=2 Tax=Companilactobacillus kimchiensis TaxID=993692 RepID=A0A0R2LGW6_9LACO|nr:fructose-bisphosphatase class III [Companilactobacillus kimchiensis]KRN99270.1 fructose-1,6-bisphosphatase [Companilactobacillus kimchiensis]
MENEFSNRNEIKSEIINLSAILSLPKGTEAFISDVHGEYDEFAHIMRNGSGNTKQKIAELFTGKLTPDSQKKLAFLIYYPSEILRKTKLQFNDEEALKQWYIDTFNHLIDILRYTGNKYTRSKVRKAIDPDYVYITEELLYADFNVDTKQLSYQKIMDNIIDLKMADSFIIATCHSIQKLVVDHVHIIGDIYDRGPHPDYIIEHLAKHWQNFDFQWGNHDILWMGSVAGSKLCMLNLLRICARYDNLSIIQNSYNIDISSLIDFARKNYVPLKSFKPKSDTGVEISSESSDIDNCVQQAVAIMQFKLEGQTIESHPDFEMNDRMLLADLDVNKNTIEISGVTYDIKDGCFQLVDSKHPFELTPAENLIVQDLLSQFGSAPKLRKHIQYLVDNGSMYLKYNGNLLLHGCIPVDTTGNLLSWTVNGKTYAGKEIFDYFDKNIRDCLNNSSTNGNSNLDIIWYLWTGKMSPLFGKEKMTTFERYFIDDDKLHQEKLNPYYSLRKKEWFADKLFQEFGLNDDGHIINGHTPVKAGMSPIMANGKIFVIDGGMSKPYHKTTGIGGYTLLSNSYGLQLVTHEPFTTRARAIADMTDVVSTKRVIEQSVHRITVSETDTGEKIKNQIVELSHRLTK